MHHFQAGVLSTVLTLTVHTTITTVIRAERPLWMLGRFSAQKVMSIVLEASENTFISHLDTFAGRQDPPVTCRIAGGWVRDKVRAGISEI